VIDVVDKKTRSRMMSGIRNKNTKPERIIRSALHRLGFRFRLHSSAVSGHPDLVLPKYHAAIFVHGCFWHGHDCAFFKWPATHRAFWLQKIRANRLRDAVVQSALRESGWRQLIVWECAVRGGGEKPILRSTTKAAQWLRSSTRRLAEIRGPAIR
jgi:DNA mismatch endonuclease (patch repair protein)